MIVFEFPDNVVYLYQQQVLELVYLQIAKDFVTSIILYIFLLWT